MASSIVSGEVLGSMVQKNRRGENPRLQLLAGTSEWRVRQGETGGQFCIFETVIPPNGGVPMHRHPENEVFYLLEGQLSFARMTEAGEEWMSAEPGDCVHVPGNEWHAFRNPATQPARMLTIGMGALGAFFEEASRLLEAGGPVQGPPSPDAIQKLGLLTKKYGQAFFGRE